MQHICCPQPKSTSGVRSIFKCHAIDLEDPDIIDCLPFCPLQPPLDLLGQDHYYTVRPHNGSTTQGLARLRVIHYGKQCNEQRRSLFYYRKKRLPENAISVMVAWLLSNQTLSVFYNSRLGKGFYVPIPLQVVDFEILSQLVDDATESGFLRRALLWVSEAAVLWPPPVWPNYLQCAVE